MEEEKYIEQYERVWRWYRRFEKINNNTEHDMASDNYQDEVYAFFINCYHLKDWIKNDPTSEIDSQQVEDFIEKSNYLKICGEFCNGFKHCLVKKARIRNREFSLLMGGGQKVLAKVRYHITYNDKDYDAFELATNCLKEWDNFLLKNDNFRVKEELKIIKK